MKNNASITEIYKRVMLRIDVNMMHKYNFIYFSMSFFKHSTYLITMAVISITNIKVATKTLIYPLLDPGINIM